LGFDSSSRLGEWLMTEKREDDRWLDQSPPSAASSWGWLLVVIAITAALWWYTCELPSM
jgi:hypothetical protein